MTTLVAWLWQGSAIAALTALALRGMPRLNAATRHVIWWLALVAVLLVPLAHVTGPEPEPAATASAGFAAPSPAVPLLLPAIPGTVVVTLAVGWLAISVLSAWRIASALRHLVRLKQQSRPFDSTREARLPMWSSVRDSERRAELRVGDIAAGAGALGLGRPMILLSRRLLDGMDDRALDQIVVHEHAHLARFDDWSRLAQAVVASVAGLHPAVWFINRQIDLEREAACDDRVVSRTGALRTYAVCLADAAAIAGRSLAPTVIPTVMGARLTLAARVERLFETRRLHTARLAGTACAAGALLLVGMVVASQTLGPMVSFVESSPPALPSPAIAARPTSEAAPVARADEVRFTHGEERAGALTQALADERSRRRPDVVRSSAAEAIPPVEEPSPAASEVVSELVAEAPRLPTLEARRLDTGSAETAPDLARPPALQTTASAARDAPPWILAADAGVAIGDRAKRSGLAIGGFFTRASKGLASAFSEPPAP